MAIGAIRVRAVEAVEEGGGGGRVNPAVGVIACGLGLALGIDSRVRVSNPRQAAY